MEDKFLKEELLRSRSFYDKRDILYAVLEDGREYTKEEAAELIKGYLEKELA